MSYPPASVHFYLALSHLSAVFLGFMPVILFAYQQELPCTDCYASCHCWVHLNLMWSLRAQWEARAVLSALLSPGFHWWWVTEFMLCRMGDTSIWKGQLGLLPDFFKNFFKCCLETKLNTTELHQICSAELIAQEERRFFIFIIIFYFFSFYKK